MAITRVEPLQSPELFPSDPIAILTGMFDECYVASDKTINDFSRHSVVRSLYEGHLFSILEHLYYANQLPDAAGLTLLQAAGIQRILGTAATVALTFTLTAPLGNTFVLSAGYVVQDNNNHQFVTDSTLVIPSGQISGTVTATASKIIGGIRQAATGTAYNVPAFSITRLLESRAFLKSVNNLEAAAGGRDEETLDEVRSRGFVALRRRDVLISADDYEQLTQEILGPGSVAIAIGRLASDKISEKDGAVHVFALNPDKTPLTILQANEIRTQLADRSPAGLQNLVSVSSLELYQASVQVVAVLLPGSDPSAVAQRIHDAIDGYLTPGNLTPGEPVVLKRVEHEIWMSGGIKSLQSVNFLVTDGTTEVSYSDLLLPNAWTAAILSDLTVELVDETTGTSYPFDYGAGDPD